MCTRTTHTNAPSLPLAIRTDPTSAPAAPHLIPLMLSKDLKLVFYNMKPRRANSKNSVKTRSRKLKKIIYYYYI